MGVLCFWLEHVTDFLNIWLKDFLSKQVGYGANTFAVPRYVEKNKDNLYLGGQASSGYCISYIAIVSQEKSKMLDIHTRILIYLMLILIGNNCILTVR
jgi:hypothetical protein